jgi:hypothetical protein
MVWCSTLSLSTTLTTNPGGSAEDLRDWLAIARREPYALLGVEETLPDAGRFFQALMSEVD